MRILIPIIITSLGGQLYAESHFYDAADRLVRSVRADGITALYTYDDANNLLEIGVANAPIAPRVLRAVLNGTTVATITWEDNADDETGYRVERRLATNYEWSLRAELPANSTSFVDTGLDPNETYVYRVLAPGAGQLTSAHSAEVAAAGPFSENFTIRSFSIHSDRLELAFDTEIGATYSLETNTTLAVEGWTGMPFSLNPGGEESTNSIQGTGNPAVLYFDLPTGSPRFYRLVRE